MITSAIAQGLTPIDAGINWGTVILSFVVAIAILLLVWHKTNPTQLDTIIAKLRELLRLKK